TSAIAAATADRRAQPDGVAIGIFRVGADDAWTPSPGAWRPERTRSPIVMSSPLPCFEAPSNQPGSCSPTQSRPCSLTLERMSGPAWRNAPSFTNELAYPSVDTTTRDGTSGA